MITKDLIMIRDSLRACADILDGCINNPPAETPDSIVINKLFKDSLIKRLDKQEKEIEALKVIIDDLPESLTKTRPNKPV